MMQFSEETKSKIFELCKKNKVRELSLFGSYARGEQNSESDIDILVDFLPNAGIGLIDYSRLQIDLSELLQVRVDLVSKKGLRKHVRDNVLADAKPIYEA